MQGITEVTSHPVLHSGKSRPGMFVMGHALSQNVARAAFGGLNSGEIVHGQCSMCKDSSFDPGLICKSKGQFLIRPGIAPVVGFGVGIGPGAVFNVEGEPLVELVVFPIHEGADSLESGAWEVGGGKEGFVEAIFGPAGAEDGDGASADLALVGEGARKVLKMLGEWRYPQSDIEIGRNIQEGKVKSLCPPEWVAFQRDTKSDNYGSRREERFAEGAIPRMLGDDLAVLDAALNETKVVVEYVKASLGEVAEGAFLEEERPNPPRFISIWGIHLGSVTVKVALSKGTS